jgi:hypothetical protein
MVGHVSVEGPGLYQDDTGHDVRAEFRELVGDGLTPEEATRRMLEGWKDLLGDDDIYCAFYLALADTQWRLGRQVPSIRETALNLIESGRDLKRWAYNDQLHQKRTAMLAQLRARLTADPPTARTVRNPAAFITDLQVGDLINYTSDAGDRYWIGIVGADTHNDQKFAIARLLAWNEADVGGAVPANVEVVAGFTFALMPYRRSDVPAKRSRRHAGAWAVPMGLRQDTLVGCSLLSWGSNLDPQLRRHRPRPERS